MRTFLHKLMVDITRHPRELVEPVWSTSWVCNAFRAYEYLLGRRAGIRFEGTALPDGSYVHGTWEHFLAHQEGRLRALKNPFAFKLVPLPVLVMPNGQTINSIFNFAIAYDNSADLSISGPLSSMSGSYTVTGSNPIVFGWSGGAIGGASTVTGFTYNSVGMTFANNVNVPSDRWWDCYLLVGPATGSHTLTANSSTSSIFFLGGSSYSGVAQTGQPDNTNTVTQTGGSAITGSITVSTANAWIAYFASLRGTTSTAVSPGVARTNTGNLQLCDSNGTVSTGSNSVSITANLTGGSAGMVMVSIKPLATAVNSGFFLLLQ